MESKQRVFVAGATGVVGQRLCRLLVADGWRVTGSTRSEGKAALLRALGVEPVAVDVYDADALLNAVQAARPHAVVHQLTDLPDALDPAQMAAALPRNARIREVGTRNLVAAAVAAGARRLVAQSIAFAYEKGPLPHAEESPIHPAAHGVLSLESQVLAAPLEGVVLRYGKFYGPGTGFDLPPKGGPVHVDAAADAARRALTRGAPGVYNIAEEDGMLICTKAAQALAWSPSFRCPA